MDPRTEKERQILEGLTRARQPSRRAKDEVRWGEVEIRRGFEEFITVLWTAAIAACHDKDLSVRERTLYLRQGDIFSAAVVELRAILVDHPDPDVQTNRLFTLYKALGSAAVIARHRMEDPAADRLRDHLRDCLRMVHPLKGRSAKKDQRDEVIMGLAEPILQRFPKRPSWRIAGEIFGQANDLLKQRGLLRGQNQKLMTQRGISGRIAQLRPPKD
jgi:hypothetical protein